MGDERTNEVYLDDVCVPDDYVVGELNHGFQYISEALDLERFTLFTYSPIAQRLDLLTEYVAHRHAGRRAAEGRRRGPVAASPSSHTEAEVARVLGLKFVFASLAGRRRPRPPRHPSTSCSPPSTPGGWPTPRWTSPGPAASSGCATEDAPMEGRSESTYRYTVIDTIGGGSSEIQKNIIARRKLGLPKNF